MTERSGSPAAAPDLSVVIVTPDGLDPIRPTLEALRAQAIRDKIELLIVSPHPEVMNLDDHLAREFWGVRCLPAGEQLREARVAGVRQAAAPVVAFAEEHSFVAPGWAEAVLAALREPWAGVGPAILNGNPGSAFSWAGVYIDFGEALSATTGGPTYRLPGHNIAYRRDVLLQCGPDLPFLLANEVLLLRELEARGCRLVLEPAARVWHINVSRPASWVRARFLGGRLFGAARARWEKWPLPRRLAFALGGPLVGLARVRFVLKHLKRTGPQGGAPPRIVPVALLGLAVHGLGESVGCLFGPGDAARRWAAYEFYRRQHVSEAERKYWNVRPAPDSA